MGELLKMKPFDVHADIGTGDGKLCFNIIPEYPESDILDIDFLVVLDGIDSGTLKLNEQGVWEWSDGDMAPDSAPIIGEQIKYHYLGKHSK